MISKNNQSIEYDYEPLVTIITVCLNAASTIRQAIESVLCQDYPNIEYVIIDGGSEDDTNDIIREYGNQITIHITEQDDGLYYAMNKGIELASGEYIIFLNSDDWYSSDCISKLVTAKNSTGSHFVSALATYINDENDRSRVMRSILLDTSVRMRMPLRHELMLIPKDIYEKISAYNTSYDIIADLEFTNRLYNNYYSCYEIQLPLLYFRTSGVSNTNRDRLLDERREYLQSNFKLLEKKDIELLVDLSGIKISEIAYLVGKYANNNDLVNCLYDFTYDRSINDLNWKEECAVERIAWPERPIVSVILPLYNAEKTLTECLKSILNQSLENIEIICINDSSPDQSFTIAKEISSTDSRIKLYENEANIGLGSTRNKGVRLACGEYIFHVDPDDILPKNSLSKLVEVADVKKCDLVKGSYIREQYIHNKRESNSQLMSICYDDNPIYNTNLIETPRLLNTTEGHWSLLYRRDFALRIPYPTDLKMGQDSLFLINAYKNAASISIIPDVVYIYRANNSSAMNTFNYPKFHDAIEWRYRAFLALRDSKELKELGEKFILYYWSENYFYSLATSLNKNTFTYLCKRLEYIFKKEEIVSIRHQTPAWLKKIFTYIHNSQIDDLYMELRKDITDSLASNHVPMREKNIINTQSQTKNYSVATISTLDFGGAGIGSRRRVSALRDHDVNVNLFVLKNKTNFPYVNKIDIHDKKGNLVSDSDVWRIISDSAVLSRDNTSNIKSRELFTNTNSVIDIKKLLIATQEHDILHLHWIVGMLDYKNITPGLITKPIVWTLADMNAFTGGCHYSEGCENYRDSCLNCPLLSNSSDTTAHDNWLIKKRAYDNIKDLVIICPSRWMAEHVKRSSLLGNRDVVVIPNPAPENDIKLFNKSVAKAKLKLPLDKILIVFGADNTNNTRKGGQLFSILVDHLTKAGLHKDIEIVTFGDNYLSADLPIHHMGYVSDNNKLSLIYSSADLFIFPSLEDNSPLTVMESLLCGTAVIAFPVGNIPDIIEHRVTGYIANYNDMESLVNGIEWYLDLSPLEKIKLSLYSRISVLNKHSASSSVNKHQNIYTSLFNGNCLIKQLPTYKRKNIYIVTPCYNMVKTIDETIRSVVNQSSGYIVHYHIQDGGSTDGTLEIIEKWYDYLTGQNNKEAITDIKFTWNSCPDTGMYDAINKGFDSFDDIGDSFLTWINADDILLGGTLDFINKVEESYPSVEWIGSHTYNITENGIENCSRKNPTPTVVINNGLCDGGDAGHWNYIQQEGTFFKNNLWDKGKYLLKSKKYAGDWALWFEFSKHAEYYQSQKPLGAFRIRKGQLSQDVKDKYLDEIDNIISREQRQNNFNQLYQRRKDLKAYTIKQIEEFPWVEITIDSKYPRDYFYSKRDRLNIKNTKNNGMYNSNMKKTIDTTNIINSADDFTYAKNSHWSLFDGLDIELYGEKVHQESADLKRYQDLFVYKIIKDNIPNGSRIAEIGGGNSRILSKLSDEYECWNIDKLEGVGNGPISANLHNVKLVKDYIGNFSSELPTNYFDFVFSVSVLEHVPKDGDILYKNILQDINRIMKAGAISCHLFDIVNRDGVFRVFHPLIEFIFNNVETINTYQSPSIAIQDDDIYYLPETVYNKIWKKYTNMSYQKFGKPSSANLLWRK